MLENMLKWMTDSDTNLTIVCRYHWSRKMTMKVDKYLKLSAQSFKYLSTFIVIFLLQRYLQTIVRLVSLSVIHFNIFSNRSKKLALLCVFFRFSFSEVVSHNYNEQGNLNLQASSLFI